MEWLHHLDKESLLELLESLDRPAWLALQGHLLALRETAQAELLESQSWGEFRETRAGIRVLDELLGIQANVTNRVDEIEQETGYGGNNDNDDRNGPRGNGGY